MRIAPAELAARLRAPPPPVIVLYGDEPLLIEESGDCVRTALRAHDYSERVRLAVEPGFDWQTLRATGQSLSLFAERRLIELRMPGGKPGDVGGRSLSEYAAEPAPDTVLLAITGRLDARVRKTRWFTALDASGFSVEHRAVRPRELAAWVRARLAARDMDADAEAVSLLAHHTEGNLLAAAQEIDKLALTAGSRRVTAADVLASTADHARFSVYTLSDECLAGHTANALRMLSGLRREGVEPVLVVWALAREVRTLVALANGLAQGRSRTALYKTQRIWNTRQPLVNAALDRLSAAAWLAVLQRIARLDRVLKGRQSGNIWLELEQCCLIICEG